MKEPPPLLPLSGLIQAIRERTPARILVSRAGAAYRTATQLELRWDQAAARDAVHAQLDPERDLGKDIMERFQLFEVQTQASSKAEYLMRPDLGRFFSTDGKAVITRNCPRQAGFQVVIGDGLSATAVAAQAPRLLPLLWEEAVAGGWQMGQPFVVRYCRVGILNDIGELLDPEMVVLLIGERPGLASADSLSAYLAYRPRRHHFDAQRNLISNIHQRGVSVQDAAGRIMRLAEKMRRLQVSGISVKED